MGFRIVVSPPWTFVGHLHKISAIWRSREATREVTFIFTRWDQTVFLLGQGDLVALIQHGGEGWREVSSARSRKRFQTGQNLFSIFHRVFAFRAYEIKLANFLRVERQLRTLLLIFGFKITRLVSMSASCVGTWLPWFPLSAPLVLHFITCYRDSRIKKGKETS